MGKAKTAIALTALILGMFLAGYLSGSGILLNLRPTATPVQKIDGWFEQNEWSNARQYVFYMDVDNTPSAPGTANIDGYNYMYINEDNEYYYIGLDLPSWRLNNTDHDYISIYPANRLPSFYNSPLTAQALLNHGLEAIHYNLKDGTVLSPSLDISNTTRREWALPFINGTDFIKMGAGTLSGNEDTLWKFDGNCLTVLPENVSGQMKAFLYIGFNIGARFPAEYRDFFFDNNTLAKITIGLFADVNGTGDAAANEPGNASLYWVVHNQHFAEPGTSEYYGLPWEYIYFNAGERVNKTFFTTFPLSYINRTTGMLYTTIAINNLGGYPYKIYLDYLSVSIDTLTVLNSSITTVSKGNYKIASSYNSTDKCGEPHRIIEIKIAKSEFPKIFGVDKLFVYIRGEGSLKCESLPIWQIAASYAPPPQYLFSPPSYSSYFFDCSSA